MRISDCLIKNEVFSENREIKKYTDANISLNCKSSLKACKEDFVKNLYLES